MVDYTRMIENDMKKFYNDEEHENFKKVINFWMNTLCSDKIISESSGHNFACHVEKKTNLYCKKQHIVKHKSENSVAKGFFKYHESNY